MVKSIDDRLLADRAPADGQASAEAVESAAQVGLSYVLDRAPGIKRMRRGHGFSYRGPDGALVRKQDVLNRIRGLAIPPAWTRVWICTDANGHLQATGRDFRGRKQYRYHSRWRTVRDEHKFERLATFARALPAIRRRVHADLALPGLPRERVLAAVVRLLEKTFIRVGNERYARDNGSYGLTTLRNRHVRVTGERIEFHFRGKSGKEHAIALDDAALAKIIRRCRELPGYELFQYREAGEVRSISAEHINAYLHQITGQDYTAKDFRTWGGTLLAGLAFARVATGANERRTAQVVAEVIRAVAAGLGNTPAICRKCYIHPEILAAYRDGSLALGVRLRRKLIPGLRREEACILAILESRNNALPIAAALRASLRTKRPTAKARRKATRSQIPVG